MKKSLLFLLISIILAVTVISFRHSYGELSTLFNKTPKKALSGMANVIGGFDTSGLSVFIATSPYSVLLNGAPFSVSLGGKSRTYDYVSTGAFINPSTGVTDFGVVQANGLTLSPVPANGIPGRIEYKGGRLMIRTVPGDTITAGKCRSQASSFPIPSRQRLFWDMTVQLGSDTPGEEWLLTPRRVSPTLIFQVKQTEPVIPGRTANPSLAVIADTDELDTTKVLLSFNSKGGTTNTISIDGVRHGLSRHIPINIFMEAYMDERETAEGGQGYWKAWVNGTLVMDVVGPTLSAFGTTPANMFADVYMYNDLDCSRYRVTYWDKLQMLVGTLVPYTPSTPPTPSTPSTPSVPTTLPTLPPPTTSIVNNGPPEVTLSSTASTVSPGARIILSWATKNANSCVGSGAWAWSGRGLSDSYAPPPIDTTSTFTLTCTGSQGTDSKSVTVTVTPPLSPVPPVRNSSITSATFANIKFGTKSPDVMLMQKILNADLTTRVARTGSGSPGAETDFFGRATATALATFQEKYASEILTPQGLTKGTGFAGTATKKKLREVGTALGL